MTKMFVKSLDKSIEQKSSITKPGKMQKQITQRMTDHLTYCGGNALIIVDEMQTFANGTLGAFHSGLQESGSFLALKSVHSYFGPAREVYHSISTENTIFLFITDIGASIIEDLVVSYGDRNKIPQSVIRKTARSALVNHTGDVDFAKLVREVIPYMPMENSQIQDLLRMKIRKLQYILNVDDSVVEYLSGPSFVEYRAVSTPSLDEMVSEYKSFAYYSGRSVTNGEIKATENHVL